MRRALIKVASPHDEIGTKNMQREVLTYCLPGLSSAKCFRKMYDIIDETAIALEWLDTTLAEVKYQPDMGILIKSVLEAALTSCVVLEGQKYVNTGRMPVCPQGATNIYYSPQTINPLISCFLKFGLIVLLLKWEI